ncbi:MAG: lytic transglycosylase domain-containing protein [Bdellovibrionales bacterium]|nr:lytic transglycosylase domain-containing protein [Bdellovibrionales bacterium]
MMPKNYCWFLLFLLFFFLIPKRAISSTLDLDPDWLKTYQTGIKLSLTSPLEACEKFISLSKIKSFPLQQLAYYRSLENCSANTSNLASTSESRIFSENDLNDLPKWLKGPALKGLLTRAIQANDIPSQIELLIAQAKMEDQLEIKIGIIQKTIQLSQQYNIKDKLEPLTAKLEELAPRYKLNPSKKDWITVAKDLKRAREFKKAKFYFQRIVSNKNFSFNEKWIALKELAQISKWEQNAKKHLLILNQIVEFTLPQKKNRSPPQWQLHLDAVLAFARATWTQGNADKAKLFLLKKIKFFRARIGLGEIYWLLGRILEENNQLPGSIQWMKKAIKEPHLSTEMSEKILWNWAWNLIKLKQWQQAINTLTMAESKTENDFVRFRFLFWLAYCEKNKGDKDSALNTYKKLSELDPLGYYGLLARREAQIPLSFDFNSQKDAITPLSKDSEKIYNYVDFKIIQWLLAVEEFELAKNYLNESFANNKNTESFDNETWVELLKLYAQTGYYQNLFEGLAQIPAQKRKQILMTHPDLLFPRPFAVLAQNAAKKTALPVELLFSIMRQESSFNPYARSPADAFGLMQILPNVAQDVATQFKLDFQIRQPEDLYRPELNILLGAFHLQDLWRKFKGRLILTAASYNANQKAVRQWFEKRRHTDPFIFIEEIPYDETRNYVRLVLRNIVFYQLLNKPVNKEELINKDVSTGDIHALFPDWVLKL